jgi:hypothetical protein
MSRVGSSYKEDAAKERALLERIQGLSRREAQNPEQTRKAVQDTVRELEAIKVSREDCTSPFPRDRCGASRGPY